MTYPIPALTPTAAAPSVQGGSRAVNTGLLPLNHPACGSAVQSQPQAGPVSPIRTGGKNR